ncbi:MFS general substrate transporter [Xylaria sp. FL0064]|nr:MFS general substrate transporter [Xylaria sp. FL0064]
MPPAGSPESDTTVPSSEDERGQVPAAKGRRFRAVFSAVCFTTLLAAIKYTVTSTALPFISHVLNAGDLYIWFVNAYFLTSTAFLPLLGQLCEFFGRRWMMLIVVTLFALDSGINGGANNAATLIGGRAVQGIGGGGINLLIELVVSDLVPLRERGAYFGIVFGVFSLGAAVGPLVGGAIVFWINLPVAGVALTLYILFFHVNYDRETTILTKLKRIDYSGNAILMASVVAVLLALSWGGSKYPWFSYHVLVPLIVGIFGLVLFHIYEGMPWTVLLSVVTGAIAGVLLSKWGRYRPLHIFAFSLISLSLGLFSRFNQHTHPAEWVLVQAVAAFGLGIMMPTNLSSVQADLPDSDTAAATAAFAFMRAYGSIWGRICDADIQKQLSGGNVYSFANADYVRNFPKPQRNKVIDVYAESFKLTWQASLGFALLGFLLCFLQKEISLRSTIDTEFGLEQKKRSTDLEGNSEKEPVIPSA